MSPGDWRDCEIHESLGEADALRRLRARAYDVIVTSPVTPVARDLAMVAEARECQPGIRTIVIAPELTPADIITALRSEVFSCFAMPVSADELRDAIAQALDAEGWKNGIEVISALPTWISLRVACRRITADRLTRFIVELAAGIPDLDRNDLATAFREVLLNAMEHGAGFDSRQGDRGGRGPHRADHRVLLQGSRPRLQSKGAGPGGDRRRSPVAPGRTARRKANGRAVSACC